MVKFFETHSNWTDKKFQMWIGKTANSYLVMKMHKAGYDPDEIARVGSISRKTVDKYILETSKMGE